MSDLLNNKKYRDEVLEARKPQFDVDPMFVNRWSTRAFSSEAITEQQLYTILEAAQYSPSANNTQPWRFYIANNEQDKELFNTFIVPRNVQWCEKASAYVLLASDRLNAEGKDNGKHAFDTGAAWQSMALQAHLLGLATRAMGGFDQAKAREVLQIPDQLVPQIVVAIGKPGTLDNLDESFHLMNKPTGRKPLSELIMNYKSE